MQDRSESESRRLLRRLRDTLAEPVRGQERLDSIVGLISESMGTDVCSIYLFRDRETLELCATRGLNPESVHRTRMRLGEGLVGRVARTATAVNTADAPNERGFRYMPETGEEIFSSFLGVPIQRLGEKLGVLVVQSKEARAYSDDEIYALDVTAMVLAEMTELGAFTSEDTVIARPHKHPVMIRAGSGQEGTAEGQVWLHEPRVVVTNLVNDDPVAEVERLRQGVERLRVSVNDLMETAATSDKEHREVLEAYRMFANSRGWLRRMEQSIESGLSAEAAVEKEQSEARARLQQVPDPYLRERLHDLDDLSNRLLRILTGQGRDTGATLPDRPILVARNIGPGELLEYGRMLKGVVLEEGSVGSHAAVVARALAIPLVVHAESVTTEALNGDAIIVDGDEGVVHLRPDDSVAAAYRDKIIMQTAAAERYAALRDLPAVARCGSHVRLMMNAGIMADLPSLNGSGAEGVGLFRTELQFLLRNSMPRRSDLAALYARVLKAAEGRRVAFRTLDIGSDKVMPYMNRPEEPNPAMGWRAVRVGLDKKGVMRMQLQALIRASNGRPLTVMFPLVAEMSEFAEARDLLMREIERERHLGHPLPATVEVGAMLETPSLAFAPDAFFKLADFVSIGGNDLKQFFYAADRENELVRRRYDTLSLSFITFIQKIVKRCEDNDCALSFCGEDAGRPVEALAFLGAGIRSLSMRPAAIGPVKDLIRRADLTEVAALIDEAKDRGEERLRPLLLNYIRGLPAV
ncbi:phosphoenolpyruvate--protein phosphotransferase [Pararhodobacter aggregans]|uniref:phosphoenolpyruvate--protein phosphotransferase n=1 Tax=Pararhodobacter aggregans TaxID=404875 RepID=A0A2T7UK20_9RHOB|nr:phosphoenolpyruvate--protein phosphotransferase [Pararhodobacter aggregans]PTW98890.1 phosphotransferase system enzyme I (PtsP) [Pararhodobacter aggregans]PVE45018.1 phosphoenolpyruvate--protein phosphotransferase [Pararhodobacter aggregans]